MYALVISHYKDDIIITQVEILHHVYGICHFAYDVDVLDAREWHCDISCTPTFTLSQSINLLNICFGS